MLKLFIFEKKITLCLLPTKIRALDLKNPLFLGKRGKKWWETDKLKKKGYYLKRENFCLTYLFNATGNQIEKKLWRFKAIGYLGGGNFGGKSRKIRHHLSLGFDVFFFFFEGEFSYRFDMSLTMSSLSISR